jgi:hypothetical protein
MGRSMVVVVFAVACGATQQTKKEPVVVADKPPPAAPGPPATRDALITATLAAISAGDVDALAKLADLDALSARATTCATKPDYAELTTATRDRIKKLVGRVKRVELISIGDDSSISTLEAGQDAGKGCTTKMRVAFHELKLNVNVMTATEVTPGHVKLWALEAGDAWYLVTEPSVDETSQGMMRAMRDFIGAEMAKCMQAVMGATP